MLCLILCVLCLELFFYVQKLNDWDRATLPFSDKQLEYFNRWERALSYEEHGAREHAVGLGVKTAAMLESEGSCFDRMRFDRVVEPTIAADDGRVLYRFCRSSTSTSRAATQSSGAVASTSRTDDALTDTLAAIDATRSLLDSRVSVGDYVTASVDGGPQSVLLGSITELTDDAVVVASRDPLRSSMAAGAKLWHWRIDRLESTSSFRQLRANVVQMLQSERLSRLIVELAAPTFRREPPAGALPALERLNDAQRQAVQKVRCANDYTLILGFVLLCFCLFFQLKKKKMFIACQAQAKVRQWLFYCSNCEQTV